MSISWIAAATSRSRASRTGPSSPASVKTERLWLASLVRSSRWTPGTERDGVGQPVDDVEPPALRDVGHGFDEHVTMLRRRPARSGPAVRG